MLDVHCRNYLQAEAAVLNLLKIDGSAPLHYSQFYIYSLSKPEQAMSCLREQEFKLRSRTRSQFQFAKSVQALLDQDEARGLAAMLKWSSALLASQKARNDFLPKALSNLSIRYRFLRRPETGLGPGQLHSVLLKQTDPALVERALSDAGWKDLAECLARYYQADVDYEGLHTLPKKVWPLFEKIVMQECFYLSGTEHDHARALRFYGMLQPSVMRKFLAKGLHL